MGFLHREALGDCVGDSARRICCWFHLRQAKIENLRVPSLGEEDIGGLDVAMNNALGVRCVESIGDFDRQISNWSVSSGRPAMRCFSVSPSRNSMAMNAGPWWSSIS
jgi:hypothetical protein